MIPRCGLETGESPKPILRAESLPLVDHREQGGAEKSADTGDRAEMVRGVKLSEEILDLLVKAFDVTLEQTQALDLLANLELQEVKIDFA